MESSTLVICQETADVPPDTTAVVLSEIIRDIDENVSEELFERLLNLDVDHEYDAPVYILASNHMWHDTHLSDYAPRSMEILVLLYESLVDQVNEETDRIRCIGVSGRYLDLIRDLAENEALELEITDTTAESTTTRSIAARSIGWVMLSLFDAVLSLLLRPFFSPTDADVLVKYPTFRPDTFFPLETRFDISFDTTFTLLTVSYFRHVRDVIHDTDSLVPIRCFDTLTGMISEYRLLVALAYDLSVRKQFETDVVEAVESETGVRLEATVGQLVRRSVWANFRTYLYYGAACRAFERGSYDSVLITSSGASGNALALPAAECDVDTYVLPHSIRAPPIGVNRPFYQGVFTEGEIASRAVKDQRTTFIPVGLPKHIDTYHKRESITTDHTGKKTLLIGTQGFADHLRREFIRETVPTVLTETDWNVVIKIHPREDPAFYHRTLAEIDINTKRNDRIQVADDDLNRWITRSKLLLTINSNVGIESVILGTAAASYNPWSPTLRHPLYAKYGPVPSLSDSAALVDLLESDIDAERSRQQSLLEGPYMVRGNSLDQLADRIQQRLGASPKTITTSDSEA